MKSLRIGLQITEAHVPNAIAAIDRAEGLGIQTAWMTQGSARPESLGILAVAASRTKRIHLGTCIVPFYPRHPVSMAQAARVVAELAPGRLRLGIGPSHAPTMVDGLGIAYDHPVGRLREYLQVLTALLQQGGPVDFQGEFYKAQVDAGTPVDLKLMASALREKSYRVVGEVAEGAISWISPLLHIQRVAIPALAAGAASQGRTRPDMIMHIPIVVHENAAEVHAAVTAGFEHYPTRTNYRNMLMEAGFPEAESGKWSPRMLDAVAVYGDEKAVERRLQEIAAAGIQEVLCSVVPTGANPAASMERTVRLLGELSQG